jgi:hypothetical protein
MTELDMLYYRANNGGRDIGIAALRALTAGALASYPAGALTLAWGDGPASAIVGYGLILVSLIFVVAIMGTSLQRIVGEVPQQLDEYELKLRARAMGAGYTGLSILVLLGIIYLAVGSDAGLWVPASYDEFNGLFWGAFLYASVLPSAFLAWQVDAADVQPEA